MNAVGSKRLKDKISQKYLWHLRLGYIREDRLNKIEKDGLLELLTFKFYLVCMSYLQKKMAKLSFMRHEERTTEILALVHTDMCGPFDV